MSGSESEKSAARLEPEVRGMKLEPDSPTADGDADVKPTVEEDGTASAALSYGIPASNGRVVKSGSQTPAKSERSNRSPGDGSEREEILGGDITVKMEPGKGPKLARSTSQKVVSRPPTLYLDAEDKTEESKGTFDVIENCTYGNKYMGSTEHALECDCAEEWGITSSSITVGIGAVFTDEAYRSRDPEKCCMRRGLRLHQSRNQNGVRW